MGAAFQVRPHKEFVPSKGRDKFLSLAIFALLAQHSSSVASDSASENQSHPSNAYEFMQRRRQETGDPTAQRQFALIRMANYSNTDIPLCVSRTGIENFTFSHSSHSFQQLVPC